MHSLSVPLFSVCVKCKSVCIGHLFDQFIFLYKFIFVYRYTDKFDLDLLEIRKGRFSHDEAHNYVKDYTRQLLIFGVKTTGHNLHNLLLL